MKDLKGRIAYVLLYGPHDFPYRDFLSDEDQMTLDKGFQQLHEGVEIALPLEKFEGGLWDKKRQNLHNMLEKSHKLFNQDDPEKHKEARMILNEFDLIIFKGK